MARSKTSAPSVQDTELKPDVGPKWAEEWVALEDIVKRADFQVRARLDGAAVSRYRAQTQAGQLAPPIKVARVAHRGGGTVLYLVDGWHRIAAEALQFDGRGLVKTGASVVLALVANMSEKDARWEAAKANIGHGVPLKTREMRGVFRAFIKSGKHRQGPKDYMSYRELAAELGVGHTTLRNWMRAEFSAIATAMGDDGRNGNPYAGPTWADPATLKGPADELREAIRNAKAGLGALDREELRDLARDVRELLGRIEARQADPSTPAGELSPF